MALLNNISNINYLEDDSGFNSKLRIFKYQRPRPGSNLLKQPIGFITLPLPTSMPSDQYSMELGAPDLGLLGGLTEYEATKGENLTKMQQTIRERLNASGAVKGLGADLVSLLAMSPAITDAFGIPGIPGAGTAQSLAGIVRNPHTALLFNNVDLRSFDFSWRFSPRSVDQSKKLNSIILTLKQAMHPNLALGGFAFDYPNLFTLQLESDKQGIVNVDYSFMQNLSINTTPNGHAYYRDGYPTIIDISFTLKEIKIKTAEDYGVTSEQKYQSLYSQGGGGAP